jgi:hypothetical protein
MRLNKRKARNSSLSTTYAAADFHALRAHGERSRRKDFAYSFVCGLEVFTQRNVGFIFQLEALIGWGVSDTLSRLTGVQITSSSKQDILRERERERERERTNIYS